MNILFLRPTDVLFFRDGRPMEGSLAGHSAAWPLPDVTNHALHAALHRAGSAFEGAHEHRFGRSGVYEQARLRKFGSLCTAGPFPVDERGSWFFPRPADTKPAEANSVAVTARPSMPPWVFGEGWAGSSLPGPLLYAVANMAPPSKGTSAEQWLSAEGYKAYLGLRSETLPSRVEGKHFLRDSEFADHESAVGIAIDATTQTTGKGEAEGKIYTAHYLRMREGFRLGVVACALDKINGRSVERRDLIKILLDGTPAKIVVGGQQRICTAERADPPGGRFPLPIGLRSPDHFNRLANGKYAVKYVLISPAIYPEIQNKKTDGTPQNAHPGGWLPSWIDPEKGRVLLRKGLGLKKAARKGGALGAPGAELTARLVAALIPKPLPVT